MQAHCKILILLNLLGGASEVFGWKEADIVRVGAIVNFSKVINYDFRARKINRTTCALSGNVQLLIESKDAALYRAGVKVFLSSNGNNQFKSFPMKADRSTIPKLLNGLYRTYVMDDLKPPVSNIPYSDDKSVDLTELIIKPANYTIYGYTISLQAIPKLIPTGLYKLVTEVTTVAGDIVGGFFVLLSVY